MDNKIGLFLCHCGDNISSKIDFKQLTDDISDDKILFVEENPYLCSSDGQEKIKETLKRFNPDAIVIGACSPKMHEHKFRRCIETAGMNGYMMDIANIREQCAWVSKDHDPTLKAENIIHSSILAMKKAVPLETIDLPVVKQSLIIGGGVSGMTSALSLAKQGIKVYLVEQSPSIGGNMVRIGKVFSADTMSEECAMCSLGPLLSEVAENPNIEILSMSHATDLNGRSGNFKINVSTEAKMIDEEKCNSCGECSRICKINVPDEWNANLSMRKAAYKPFTQSVPSSYTIDVDACVKCGSCVDICPANAINLNNKITESVLNVGAVVVATGYKELNPEDKEELGYKKFPDVITQMELARLFAVNGPTSGNLVVPSTGKKPKRIVMIQCVGSRDRKPGSIPHCSTICCMTALKHSNYIITHYKGTEIYICYTDMRTPGTYENYYFETQKKGEKSIKFIRGKVAEVKMDENKIMSARVEDTLGGGVIDIQTDLVVLSCALEPSETILELEKSLKISLTEEMFVKEKNPKMDPTQTTVPGIFVAGSASGAMDITDSINMARSSASMVTELLYNENIEIKPEFAIIDMDKCDACEDCIVNCPANAIFKDEHVRIDPIKCLGCGYCISKCNQNAITRPLYSDDEIFARIDGSLMNEIPIILTFLDNEIAYTAADNMGSNRLNYPSEVRIIKIPSILRLELKHLLYAFKNGAQGIFLGDGNGNITGNILKDRLNEKVEELKDGVFKAGLDPDCVYFYNAYLPHHNGLATKLKEFQKILKKNKWDLHLNSNFPE